ncbi:MAG: U-box domain-containing protein, partial [Proteobacteria bacterium]|nr:U-box domain-containing protein [Pseudomonadota bacterium]
MNNLIPVSYICPISGDIMTDPVTDYEGNTYERSYITRALQNSGCSPITRSPLRSEQLYTNRNLKDAIDLFVQQNPQTVQLFRNSGITSANQYNHHFQPEHNLQIPQHHNQHIQLNTNLNSFSYVTDTDLVIVTGSAT